jgi:hypothetical protein
MSLFLDRMVLNLYLNDNRRDATGPPRPKVESDHFAPYVNGDQEVAILESPTAGSHCDSAQAAGRQPGQFDSMEALLRVAG